MNLGRYLTNVDGLSTSVVVIGDGVRVPFGNLAVSVNTTSYRNRCISS